MPVGIYEHKPHSEKTKRKMSETRKGRHHSEETKLLLSKNNARYWLGKHPSEEHKRKLSEASKGINSYWYGKQRSAETKRKISEANKGRIISIETREKIGKVNIGKHRSEEAKKNISESMKGKLNHCWKGGKTIRDRGYIAILSPNHPYRNSRNYVLEHRLVMEAHIGRILLPTEVVHHINGITHDNRIENLMLFSNQTDHVKYQKKLKTEVEL